MVATRRSGAKIVSTSNVSSKATKRRKVTGNGPAETSDKLVICQPLISRDPSMSTNRTALSNPSSELGNLTPTSPPTGRTSERCFIDKPDATTIWQASPLTKKVVTASQKLIRPGSSHNPIVLVEDSPPTNPQVKMGQYRKAEQSRFRERYSKLYTYEPLQSVLAPKPANGSLFISHQRHDIHCKPAAKIAQSERHLSRAQHVQQGFPFEAQYPMSAQYPVPQRSVLYSPPKPDIRYCIPRLSIHTQRMTPPPPNEEQLRRKAVQYVREHSRPLPRKRKMPEGPDETSESEPEQIDRNKALSPHKQDLTEVLDSPIKSKGSDFTLLPDRHFQLTALIEHASLLTSLLRIYPYSTDSKGLRDDIKMLASAQSQHLDDWLDFEIHQSQKQATSYTPRVSRIATISSAKPIAPYVTNQELSKAEKRRKQDDEIRGLLSADARLWQDGSGLSVADVYADTRGSTPPIVKVEGEEVWGKVDTASVCADRQAYDSVVVLPRSGM